MIFNKKISYIIVIFMSSILLISFTNETILSKLKSLSKILQYIDRFYVEDVEMEKILNGAIHGLLNELDPHSSYIEPKDADSVKEQIEGEFEGIGIEFAILDGYITVVSPIPDTPSDRAGLISGDKITKINQESAYMITQDEVFDKLRGPKGSKVDLTIKRQGIDPFEVTLKRAKIPIFSISAALLYNDDTGYIKMNRFGQKTFQELYQSIDSLKNVGMKNIVLDLRNNPGGLMDQAIEIVDLFINSNDTILFTKGRIRSANEIFYASKSRNDNKMPIITLMNRGSASASEIVSGAIQDLDRGLVVGETSFGKGLVQRQFPLDDGSMVRITIAKYYTPSGRMIQRSYDEGKDTYYTDIWTEDNREVNDSTLALRPTFKTKKGRHVYGGGGITPDIFINNDYEYQDKTQRLLTNPERLIFKYANILSPEFEQFTSFNNYSDAIKNSSFLHINKFIDWVNDIDKEMLLTKEEIELDWAKIQNRIYAEIARIFWGNNFYYHIILNEDVQFQVALENLEKAKNMIK